MGIDHVEVGVNSIEETTHQSGLLADTCLVVGYNVKDSRQEDNAPANGVATVGRQVSEGVEGGQVGAGKIDGPEGVLIPQ